MANIYYDINLSSTSLKPFVGIGAGGVTVHSKFDFPAAGTQSAINSSKTSSNYGFQLSLGARYPLPSASNINLYAQYKHIMAPNIKIDTSGQIVNGSTSPTTERYSNNLFNVGLSYRFSM
ncbi:MAG: outer membrane beta-barrel protein [Pseudomonadota bacterium]